MRKVSNALWWIGFWMCYYPGTMFGILFQEEKCKEWDKTLRHLLQNHELKVCTTHTHQLNGVVIWTSNRVYSFGHEHCYRAPAYRPGFITMGLLLREVERLDAIEKVKKEMALAAYYKGMRK